MEKKNIFSFFGIDDGKRWKFLIMFFFGIAWFDLDSCNVYKKEREKDDVIDENTIVIQCCFQDSSCLCSSCCCFCSTFYSINVNSNAHRITIEFFIFIFFASYHYSFPLHLFITFSFWISSTTHTQTNKFNSSSVVQPLSRYKSLKGKGKKFCFHQKKVLAEYWKVCLFHLQNNQIETNLGRKTEKKTFHKHLSWALKKWPMKQSNNKHRNMFKNSICKKIIIIIIITINNNVANNKKNMRKSKIQIQFQLEYLIHEYMWMDIINLIFFLSVCLSLSL